MGGLFLLSKDRLSKTAFSLRLAASGAEFPGEYLVAVTGEGRAACIKHLLDNLPSRTGQLPTRSPRRPGRAQLRHPVPLVKVSLNNKNE